MIAEFEIIKVFDVHTRGQFISARQVHIGQDFNVKEGSLLGGIPISNYVDMPRMLDENGQPRFDVFAFIPIERVTADYFKEGQVVKLITPDL